MLKFRDFTFFYKGEATPSLKHIHLEIAEGEFVLLCGSSGCGKTTLLRVINGLYPGVYEGRTEGSYDIDEQLTDPLKSVGSVLQDAKAGFLFQEPTAECVFPAQCASRAKEEILREFALLQKENASLFAGGNSLTLSAGQAQLLNILAQRMKKAKLLVMDEPSANLDLAEIRKLHNYLSDLKKQGFTVIIAEHRLQLFAGLVDRTVMLRDGEIVSPSNRKIRRRRKTLPRKAPPVDSGSRLDILQLNYARHKRMLLKDVHLTLRSGSVVAVIGNNGAGKSTFAKALCGLVKCKSRKIAIERKLLTDKELVENCYYAMQDSYKQMVASTLAEEVLLQDPSLSDKEVLDYLSEVDLAPFAGRHPSTLSGGQVQRLGILLAFISRSKVVVLDEPTSGLDPAHVLQIGRLLEKMKKQQRFLLVISHDWEFLSAVADDYVWVKDGNVSAVEDVSARHLRRIKAEMISREKPEETSVVADMVYSGLNPIVNVLVFFASANAVFLYPYNVPSWYLLIAVLGIMISNRNYVMSIKCLLKYGGISFVKPFLPLSLQVVTDIFVLRGLCAGYAFRNILASAPLPLVIEAFHKAKFTDYILLPLLCMLRIFPTFRYDMDVCLMGIRTRKLIRNKNPVRIWNRMMVPLVHSLIRTAENLACGIVTKGMRAKEKRTLLTGVAFRLYDAVVLILFFGMYISLILGGIK